MPSGTDGNQWEPMREGMSTTTAGNLGLSLVGERDGSGRRDDTAGSGVLGSCIEDRFASLLGALDRELLTLPSSSRHLALTALLAYAARLSMSLVAQAEDSACSTCTESVPTEQNPGQAAIPRLLTDREAAELARVTVRWLRRHTRGLSFRRDLSRKQVCYEEPGLRRWLMARRSR